MFGRSIAGLVLMVVVLGVVPGVLAQGTEEVTPPEIIICGATECRYSSTSGRFSADDVAMLMGEPDPHGKNTVICTGSAGCQWSDLDSTDLELLYDQTILDAENAMTFEEDEVDPISAETDVIELEDEELTFRSVVPLPGTWVTYHDPTQLVCNTGMTIDVPGSGPDSATISVSEDGSTLTGLALDPESPPQDMFRTPDGHYRNVIEFAQDGGTMTLVIEVFFLDEALGFGFIDSRIAQMDYSCTLLRSFVTELEGAFPAADGDTAQ